MSPPILHPHLSLSTTRTTCATSTATQHAVNGDNLRGYACWFMSRAASHRPDRGRAGLETTSPSPLLSRTDKTPPHPERTGQKQARQMFYYWHRPSTTFGSAQFGLKERGWTPGDSLGRPVSPPEPPASKHHHHTTPPPLAGRQYPHNPSLRRCPHTGVKSWREGDTIPSPTVHNMHTSTRVPRPVHSRPSTEIGRQERGVTGENGNTLAHFLTSHSQTSMTLPPQTTMRQV